MLRWGRTTSTTCSTFAFSCSIRSHQSLSPTTIGTIAPVDQIYILLVHFFWTNSLFFQLVHPLLSTILLPVCALVILNLRVLSRVPSASRPRSASRRRFSIWQRQNLETSFKKFHVIKRKYRIIAGEQPTSTWQRFAVESFWFSSSATSRASPSVDLRSGGNNPLLATCPLVYLSPFLFSVPGSQRYFVALNHWSFTGLLRHRWVPCICMNIYCEASRGWLKSNLLV